MTRVNELRNKDFLLWRTFAVSGVMLMFLEKAKYLEFTYFLSIIVIE